MVSIGNDWDAILKDEFDKEYYHFLRKFLVMEYRTQTIYPAAENIFNALRYTAYQDVKVVILGQDPYHGEGQAHGLCFSVQKGVQTPPSLLNIYKELQTELGCFIPNNGYLEKWTRQGVMLLNTVLTVRADHANSHRNKGWEIFTNRVICELNDRSDPIIFLLWGNPAKTKMSLITNPQHYVLTAAHPSPLSASRGFFGCGHFAKTNELLKTMGKTPIDWQIENC